MKCQREYDYTWFLNAFKAFCFQHLNLNVDDKIKYTIIDACDAEFNAIKAVFPSCTVLMCWFHVIKNIKEVIKRLRIPVELACMIKEIFKIYMFHLTLINFNTNWIL